MLGILERIRNKKRELTQNTATAYLTLVRDVAAGAEIDVEHAAIVIEQAGKDDAAFEKDVATQQARVTLALQLRRKKELEHQLPKLEHVERLAGEHYAKVVGEASARLNEAKNTAKAVSLEIMQYMQTETRLLESCLDETLLARERELGVLRMEIHQKLRPLDDDIKRSRNMIASHESTVKALEKKSTDKLINPIGRASYKKELEQNERALAHEQHIHRQLSKAVAELNEQLAPIDSELATIRQKKLEV